MDDNHLKKGISSRKELAHDSLEEGLFTEILFLGIELDVERCNHLVVLFRLELHDAVKELVDGSENKLVETTFESLS